MAASWTSINYNAGWRAVQLLIIERVGMESVLVYLGTPSGQYTIIPALGNYHRQVIMSEAGSSSSLLLSDQRKRPLSLMSETPQMQMMDSQQHDTDAPAKRRWRMWSDSTGEPHQQDQEQYDDALAMSAMQQHALERERSATTHSELSHPQPQLLNRAPLQPLQQLTNSLNASQLQKNAAPVSGFTGLALRQAARVVPSNVLVEAAPQAHAFASSAEGDHAPSQSVQDPSTPTDEELEDVECEHQLTLIKMQRLQSELHEQAGRAKMYELLIESMKRIRDEKRGRRVMKKVNEVIRDARSRNGAK